MFHGQVDAFLSESLEVNEQGCQNDFGKNKSAQEAPERHSINIKERLTGLAHLLGSVMRGEGVEKSRSREWAFQECVPLSWEQEIHSLGKGGPCGWSGRPRCGREAGGEPGQGGLQALRTGLWTRPALPLCLFRAAKCFSNISRLEELDPNS